MDKDISHQSFNAHLSPFYHFVLFLFPLLFIQTLSLQAQEGLRLVLVENSDIGPNENRLHFPLLISHGKGFRIKCLNQSDEEKVIRGAGFLLMPSEVEDPLSPEIMSSAPEDQPFLCPLSPQYPIKLYRHNPGPGEQFYMHFPAGFNDRNYGNSLFIAGCSGLLKGLNLDPSKAIAADPTPFFGDKIYPIQCMTGGPVTVKPKTFAEWCLKGDLSQEQKTTVEVLLFRTPPGVNALGNVEACEEARLFLEGSLTLNLKRQGLTNIEPLSTLKNITKLILSDNPIKDLRPLSEMTSLTHLDLSFTETEKINPLANLTKLLDLNLSHNKILDLRALSSLQLLEKINLGHNLIQDNELSSLNILVNLKNINLQNNEITDPSTLQELENLVFLDLSFNKIKNAQTLTVFRPTVQLKVESNPLENFNFLILCGLHRNDPTPQGNTIRELLLLAGGGDCQVGTQKLESMTQITLNDKGIADLTPFQYLKNLRILDLSKNSIESVHSLGHHPAITKLNLSNNHIKSMGSLKTILNLSELRIDGNPIEHDSFLSWCHFQQNDQFVTSYHRRAIGVLLEKARTLNCMQADRHLSLLKELNLENKDIEGVGPIGELKNLETLYLGKNKIFDLSFLKKLENLKLLSLKDNYNIYSMTDLYSLRNLVDLDLSGNPLHNLDYPAEMDLPPFPQLKRLNLGQTSISHIETLDNFAILETVNLEGMPIRPSSFVSFCLLYKFFPHDYYLDTARSTMKAIHELMKSHSFALKNCGEAMNWLSSLTQLELPGQQIMDPRPLVDVFTKNKILDLRNNLIESYYFAEAILMKADENRRSLPGKIKLDLYLKGNPICVNIPNPTLPPGTDLSLPFQYDFLLGRACHEGSP